MLKINNFYQFSDSLIVVVFHLFYTVFQLAVGLAFVAIVARKTGLPMIDILDKGGAKKGFSTRKCLP